MSTFPPVAAPTPDQWLWRISRQVLGAPAAAVTISGIATGYQTMRLELRAVKDGTAAGVNLQLNTGGGGVDYLTDITTSATIFNVGAVGSSTIPFATATFQIAANRDGFWTAYIAQGPPKQACVIINGGLFRSASAVPIIFESYGIWNLGSQYITSMTITSESGSLAANTAIALTGDDHV